MSPNPVTRSFDLFGWILDALDVLEIVGWIVSH
jgi:hypothetical protein